MINHNPENGNKKLKAYIFNTEMFDRMHKCVNIPAWEFYQDKCSDGNQEVKKSQFIHFLSNTCLPALCNCEKGIQSKKKIDRKRQRFETVAIKQQDIDHKTYTEKFKSLGRVCYF